MDRRHDGICALLQSGFGFARKYCREKKGLVQIRPDGEFVPQMHACSRAAVRSRPRAVAELARWLDGQTRASGIAALPRRISPCGCFTPTGDGQAHASSPNRLLFPARAALQAGAVNLPCLTAVARDGPISGRAWPDRRRSLGARRTVQRQQGLAIALPIPPPLSHRGD